MQSTAAGDSGQQKGERRRNVVVAATQIGHKLSILRGSNQIRPSNSAVTGCPPPPLHLSSLSVSPLSRFAHLLIIFLHFLKTAPLYLHIFKSPPCRRICPRATARLVTPALRLPSVLCRYFFRALHSRRRKNVTVYWVMAIVFGKHRDRRVAPSREH
ncbi:hypothetical protein DENSPDRAFT_398299 [Dentipellis sp. KUC8613]|nr:hypothetical protein DENSPDRAFT_398299 [Dentipellis sp. KUC8613]